VERRNREVTEQLRKALAMEAMSDEEVAALRQSEPRLAWAMKDYRPMYQLVVGLSADKLDQVLTGERVSLSFHQLNPERQAIVQALAKPIQYVASAPGPDGSYVPIERYDGTVDYPKSNLVVWLTGNPERPGVSGNIWVSPHTATGSENLLYPGLPNEEDRPEWLRSVLAEEQRRQPRARRSKPPKDPDLLHKVTVRHKVKAGPGERSPGQERRCDLADALRQVAEQSGPPLIADYDPGYQNYYERAWPVALTQDLVDVPVWEALDYAADLWHVKWERSKQGWLRVHRSRILYAEADGLDLSPPCEKKQAPAPGGATPAPKPPAS
jgi:hypothetical protein